MVRRRSRLLFVNLICIVSLAFLFGCSSESSNSGQNGDGSGSGTQNDPITIKLAHPNVPAHPMGEGFIKFKELVEEKTNGEIKVEIFDSSTFGNARETVEGLQMGTLQMGSDSAPNLAPFTDGLLIFDMPFLFPDYPSTDLVTDGPIGEELREALLSSNVRGLGFIEIGFRHIFNNVRPIEKLEDLEGLKIRATNSDAHIGTLEALGANPTPIAWGEVFTALQQKTVDGIDIDLNLAHFNNFPEVQKYLTIVGSIYSPHMVMINEPFFQSLSEEHKTIILDSFDEMKVFQRNLIRKNEEMIIEKMEENGVEVTLLSPEERARWGEAAASVYDKYEDVIGKDLIEEVKELVTK
ncbi:TRAP transporter substrate-binding protein [Anaerobacillus sp. MEB173]|uniref:TRAP transporter substrate-binding protein n=1 Tax=Anaerobacillus sp. MEB173 TaxID=3383345 RepID=UPI003F9208CB